MTTPSGARFRFGRNRPPPQRMMVPFLGDYLAPVLLPAPAVNVDWGEAEMNQVGLENILANDTLGLCVEAACGHLIDVWHGEAGTGANVTADQTIAFYSASSGYDPNAPLNAHGNNPTDSGSDEITVLDYWNQNGFASGMNPIVGYVSVDPTNIVQVKTAIWLFGGLLLCGELLSAWVAGMQTMDTGFCWDVGSAPDPKAGHGIMSYGYDENGNLKIISWGIPGTLTPGAITQFANPAVGGGCYAVLHQDWIAKATALAPSGFAFSQLSADLGALSGG